MPASETSYADLRNHQFISLATFRKNGDAVATPVTIGQINDSDKLYVITGLKTGKVKRLRNNPVVELAPCDQGGKLTGGTVAARARILSAAEVEALRPQMKFSSTPFARFIFNVIRTLRWGGNVYLEISPA